MKRSLTSLQSLALNKFSEIRVASLFMEMGTGKTQVAVELINRNKRFINFVLFFCPVSTKKNLEAEIKKCNIADVDYEIFGWETLSQSDAKYLDLLERVKDKKLFIVADESSFVKNGDTKRYKRLLEVSKNSIFRIILNGTPIIKNEFDIYYQMNFLSPKILDMSIENFKYNYFTEYRDGMKKWYKFSAVNADHLYSKIKNYCFHANLDFKKEIKEEFIEIEPSTETLKKYKKTKKIMLDQDLDFISITSLLTKLIGIAANDKTKIDAIKQYLLYKNNKIVFCTRKDEAKAIAGTDYLLITGETPKKERDIIFSKFATKKYNLIMTFGVGSFGLNLQTCDHVIFSSLSFDYGKYEQSKARIKRLGQENNIKYTTYLSKLGIVELCQENLTRKQTMSDFIKNKKGGEIYECL